MIKKCGFSIPVILTVVLMIGACSPTSKILTTPTSMPVDAPSDVKPASTPADVAPAGPTASKAAGPSSAISGEHLADGELGISSYPPNAEVYLVPATVDVYDLELDDVVRPENLIGAAPLTYELSPGMYYLVTVFTPDLFAAIGYDLPSVSDPTYNDAFPFDGNLSQSMSFIGGEEIGRISKIYRLNKDAGRSETLISIALPLPEKQRGQQKPVLYPTFATVEALPTGYTFDAAVVGRAIQDNLDKYDLAAIVGPAMVDEMVEVLLRVGKVKLDTNDVDLIIYMQGTDTGNFSIVVYGR